MKKFLLPANSQALAHFKNYLMTNMMEQAVAVRKKSYAYSKFRVGAALLLDNGQTVLGSNQENAAYPSGL
jgi:cytidine deaminase